MKYEFYRDIEIDDAYEIFEFVNFGEKGKIHKRIIFDLIEVPNIYNLAFGDIQQDGSIDDFSVSDNKDVEKILATIARIIKLFFDNHPESLVFFTAVQRQEQDYIEWR